MIISQKNWLEITGWTHTEFAKRLKAGFPVLSRPSTRGEDYRIDSVEAVRWVELQAAGPEKASKMVLDLSTERARLAKEQADKEEFENKRRRGDLVTKDEHLAVLQAAIGSIPGKFWGLPARLAPIVAPDDPKRAREVLQQGVEEVAADIRETLARLQPPRAA
jgi:phage terminase Nu1 subunit (DNA packaging protein)